VHTTHTILDNLPSLCQKLSDLVEVCRSYSKNNFACFFRHGVGCISAGRQSQAHRHRAVTKITSCIRCSAYLDFLPLR